MKISFDTKYDIGDVVYHIVHVTKAEKICSECGQQDWSKKVSCNQVEGPFYISYIQLNADGSHRYSYTSREPHMPLGALPSYSREEDKLYSTYGAAQKKCDELNDSSNHSK